MANLWLVWLAFVLVAVRSATAAVTCHPSVPPMGTLEGLGVQVEMRDSMPGEVKTMAATGFK